MNRGNVEDARELAERLVARATDYLNVGGLGNSWEYPKESGALRRASMELTRALAEMRRPG